MKNFKYLLLSLIIFSCTSNNESILNDKIIIDSLKTQLSSKVEVLKSLEYEKVNNDSIVNQYALYIEKIKENINEINKQESIINNAKNNPDFITIDTTDVINAIKILSMKLQENESMIEELSNAVILEKDKNSQFASSVTQLSVQIAKSNREIYFLKEELNSINASFESVFNKYTLQNIKINDLNQKLNQVAFAIGTKTELLNNGVLTKSGGLIGIVKSRKLNNDLNTDYFTYTSRLEFRKLILGFKSVKLITSHPTGSFKIHKSSKEKIDSLEILDNDDFWRNSKFLVVEVK
ncbi:MAG: hypothetical protein ISQ95_02375 [Flavobacteriales bacterium]|nr:hypothetical protein [Flavobacteriales bacterium]